MSTVILKSFKGRRKEVQISRHKTSRGDVMCNTGNAANTSLIVSGGGWVPHSGHSLGIEMLSNYGVHT